MSRVAPVRAAQVRRDTCGQERGSTAGPEAALDLVRETSEEVSTLLVVGHNPTMAYLAHLLDDGEGDDAATSEMVSRGYPTAAAAVFAVDGSWADLGPGRARLEAFHVARG